ncbi:MAG: hypothetical protein Q9169_006794 [Polycauliona sp. 2 TL-2023]
MAAITLRLRSLGIALVLIIATIYLSGQTIKAIGANKSSSLGNDVHLVQGPLWDEIGSDAARLGPRNSSVGSSFTTSDQDIHQIPDQSDGYFVSQDSHLEKRLSEGCSQLVQNGVKLISGVWKAFDGNNPDPTTFFTNAVELAKAHGWQRTLIPNVPLPEVWKDALGTVSASVPDYKEFPPLGKTTENTQIKWNHRLPYAYRDKVPKPPTGAQYKTLYIPSAKPIISRGAWSPRATIEAKLKRITPEDIAKRLPDLNRLSDVMWLDWDSLVKLQKDQVGLRYVAREDIRGKDAVQLFEEISKTRKQTVDIPWSKRMTFEVDSSEGLALLGTQHGTGLAWILIHRAKILGPRDPQVTIFNPGGKNPCMIGI